MENNFDGGEAILEAFRNRGIDYVVCSPGSQWPPVWEALARQKIGHRKIGTHTISQRECAIRTTCATAKLCASQFSPGSAADFRDPIDRDIVTWKRLFE